MVFPEDESNSVREDAVVLGVIMPLPGKAAADDVKLADGFDVSARSNTESIHI